MTTTNGVSACVFVNVPVCVSLYDPMAVRTMNCLNKRVEFIFPFFHFLLLCLLLLMFTCITPYVSDVVAAMVQRYSQSAVQGHPCATAAKGASVCACVRMQASKQKTTKDDSHLHSLPLSIVKSNGVVHQRSNSSNSGTTPAATVQHHRAS